MELNEKYILATCDEAEKRFRNPLQIKERKAFVLGAHFGFGWYGGGVSEMLEMLKTIELTTAGMTGLPFSHFRLQRVIKNSEALVAREGSDRG